MRYVGLGRDNLRSHFVFRLRHAPEWLHARFLPVVFLTNEEELTGKTFTTFLTTTNPNIYVKFIFLRTSPFTVALIWGTKLCQWLSDDNWWAFARKLQCRIYSTNQRCKGQLVWIGLGYAWFVQSAQSSTISGSCWRYQAKLWPFWKPMPHPCLANTKKSSRKGRFGGDHMCVMCKIHQTCPSLAEVSSVQKCRDKKHDRSQTT